MPCRLMHRWRPRLSGLSVKVNPATGAASGVGFDCDPQAHEMLSNLQGDYATGIRQIRSDAETCQEAYQDAGTHDFLIGVMLQHEKIAWMLRAFLEGKSV